MKEREEGREAGSQVRCLGFIPAVLGSHWRMQPSKDGACWGTETCLELGEFIGFASVTLVLTPPCHSSWLTSHPSDLLWGQWTLELMIKQEWFTCDPPAIQINPCISSAQHWVVKMFTCLPQVYYKLLEDRGQGLFHLCILNAHISNISQALNHSWNEPSMTPEGICKVWVGQEILEETQKELLGRKEAVNKL